MCVFLISCWFKIQSQTSGVIDECEIPLQQLARLKEKLIKHARAEDAAVKRIRDLEMQLTSSKQEFEVFIFDNECIFLIFFV